MEITEDRDGTYMYTTTKYNRTPRATNQAEDSRSSIIFVYDDHHILAGGSFQTTTKSTGEPPKCKLAEHPKLLPTLSLTSGGRYKEE